MLWKFINFTLTHVRNKLVYVQLYYMNERGTQAQFLSVLFKTMSV